MTHRFLAIIVSSLSLWSCSAPQAPPPPDVRVLMRTGRYDEAIVEAERLVGERRDVLSLALLATARTAAAAPDGSTDSASEALLQAVGLSSRGEAIEAFSTEVTGSMAFSALRFSAASRAVAPLTQGWEGSPEDADARRGAAALLGLGAYGAEQHAPTATLMPILNVAIQLLESSTNDLVFPDAEMHNAWVCFRSAGTLAAVATQADSGPSSRLAAELAVRIVESNPQLAIPVMCDLSSPRNGLREALRRNHDAQSLARLSTAMESAEGCSLGTYAP